MITSYDFSIIDIVSQKSGNIVSDMDGEKVMLSINNGKYYNLGTIGGEIWEYLEEPISIEKLVNTLLKDFDVEKSKCEEEVFTFLELLYKQDLIQVEGRQYDKQS